MRRFAQMATVLLFVLLIFRSSVGEDSVAVDLGSNQMQRLVDLLTVHECEELLINLSNPEENICNQLHCLPEETNQIRTPPHAPRDAESHCHPALINWLQTHGEQMYYDKLFYTLQQIGRTDIAIELGKNINQDKTLAIRRYVEEYHDQVNKMASQLTHLQAEKRRHKKTHSAKQARSLSWKDLDLVVEWPPIPPYHRHMLDGAWPLLIGLIFGVGGALLLGMPLLLFILGLTT